MSSLFGGGSSTPAPAPVPTIAHEEVQAAGDTARKRERAAAGRASTILAPLTQSSANIGTTALLGG